MGWNVHDNYRTWTVSAPGAADVKFRTERAAMSHVKMHHDLGRTAKVTVRDHVGGLEGLEGKIVKTTTYKPKGKR
jgi:predicted transcriptional regulator